MYLIAEEAWELANPLVKALPGASGRLFACVEVDLNFPLWHLDILMTAANGMEYWRRFVSTSLEQAVATAAEYPGRSQLHYQSALSIRTDSSYYFLPVKKVLAGSSSDGLPAYLLVFPDGQEIYPNRHLPSSEFTSVSCVYETGNFGSAF